MNILKRINLLSISSPGSLGPCFVVLTVPSCPQHSPASVSADPVQPVSGGASRRERGGTEGRGGRAGAGRAHIHIVTSRRCDSKAGYSRRRTSQKVPFHPPCCRRVSDMCRVSLDIRLGSLSRRSVPDTLCSAYAQSRMLSIEWANVVARRMYISNLEGRARKESGRVDLDFNASAARFTYNKDFIWFRPRRLEAHNQCAPARSPQPVCSSPPARAGFL